MGVNRFVTDEPTPDLATYELDAEGRNRQRNRLATVKAQRDTAAVRTRLADLVRAAEGTGNLMGPLIDYLNEGTEPQRLPFGAHSYYVPAQLFPTAEGYLALFVTHDGFWKSFAAEAGIAGFLTMAERAAQREEVLAAVTQALAADTAVAWESRLRRLGVPAAAVRTLPEALVAAPDVIVTVGRYQLVRSPVHVAGYDPDYRPPPRLGEHGSPP